jgi:hypothetical protein
MNPWFAAGATAILVSERGRNLLRRGIVYAVANAMNAGDTFASAATEVAHGAERVASSAGGLAGDLVGEAQEARNSAENGVAEKAPSSAPKRARPARSTPAKGAGARR